MKMISTFLLTSTHQLCQKFQLKPIPYTAFRHSCSLLAKAIRVNISAKYLKMTPGSLIVLHNIKIMSSAAGMVESVIRNKLQTALDATHIDIVNESYMHNVPKGAETHFKVVVVSDKFDGLTLLKRHRLINDILRDELKSKIHALSIIAKTQQQWDESDKVVESSPQCRGGFGK